jgi:4-hydroxy-3-polyprenylbenzoate decarboxylase
MRIVTAITGASGAIYGARFVQRAAELGADVDLLVSAAGARVARDELGHPLDPRSGPFHAVLGPLAERVRRIPVGDIGAEAASGSIPFAGMVVIPCSMGTAARIAHGIAQTLIERAADVMLKERRRLVVVPRETPFNRIHLENLLALDAAGAVVLPAMPAFYAGGGDVASLVDSVVDRALSFFFGPEVIRGRWIPEAQRHAERGDDDTDDSQGSGESGESGESHAVEGPS